VIVIDILHLVDRLESLLNESRRIPLTSNRLVDEELFLNIIDQMRISIPEEIKKGKRIQQERGRIIAQANEGYPPTNLRSRPSAARRRSLNGPSAKPRRSRPTQIPIPTVSSLNSKSNSPLC